MPLDSLPAHLRLGTSGEEIAAAFLRELGYDIRGRNLRIGRDEIDLLAFDPADNVLVFAEVKTRSQLWADFAPELTASHRKRQKLRRAARRWVAAHDYDGGYRIDLLCVRDGKVTEHFRELDWE